MGLALISAHSCRVVRPMKNFLGAGGVGIGIGQGSGIGVGDLGVGSLMGELGGVGIVWDGPSCSLWAMMSALVSESVCSSLHSPDSEG